MAITTNGTRKRYVSAIEDLDAKEINRQIIGINNDFGLTDVMNAFGRYKPSTMYKVQSYVDEPIWKKGTVNGAPTGSGTATVTATLSVSTSGGRRKNDLVRFPNGKNGIVTNVATAAGADTLTIISVDGTNLTLADTNSLTFFSNVVGERSDKRQPLFIGIAQYFNLLQIFRESHSTSDVQLLSKVEVPEHGVWAVREYAERFLKLKAEVNAAHILGQISNSQFSTTTGQILDPSNSAEILQTERGLHQYITSWGINDTVGTPGSVGLTTDIADFIAALVAKKTDTKYMLWGSTEALMPLDMLLKGLGSSDVTTARMNVDGRVLNFEVDKWTIGGFTFQKTLLPILNHPELMGGTDPAKGLYFIPEGMVRASQEYGGQVSYQPRIQIRYKPQPKTIANKGSDVWAEIHGGAYSQVNPNGTVAEATVDWVTHQCVEVLGPQHFGFLKVLS